MFPHNKSMVMVKINKANFVISWAKMWLLVAYFVVN